jgi:hypothetical protein
MHFSLFSWSQLWHGYRLSESQILTVFGLDGQGLNPGMTHVFDTTSCLQWLSSQGYSGQSGKETVCSQIQEPTLCAILSSECFTTTSIDNFPGVHPSLLISDLTACMSSTSDNKFVHLEEIYAFAKELSALS